MSTMPVPPHWTSSSVISWVFTEKRALYRGRWAFLALSAHWSSVGSTFQANPTSLKRVTSGTLRAIWVRSWVLRSALAMVGSRCKFASTTLMCCSGGSNSHSGPYLFCLVFQRGVEEAASCSTSRGGIRSGRSVGTSCAGRESFCSGGGLGGGRAVGGDSGGGSGGGRGVGGGSGGGRRVELRV